MLLRSLLTLLLGVVSWVPRARASCNDQLTAYFDRDPEAAMRAGEARPIPAEVLSLKNNAAGEAGRVVHVDQIVRPHDPRAHRALVTSLRRGDRIETAGGAYELGEFRGWGGTTHLFRVEGAGGWLVRLPRAVRILYTNPNYATREQKTMYFYEIFRRSLTKAIHAGLPLLPMRDVNGLILVKDVRPFETAAHLARDRSSPHFGARRLALVDFLRNLAGRPGLTDLHLDAVVWDPEAHAFRIADFEAFTPAPRDHRYLSEAYGPLVNEAFSVGLVTPADRIPPQEWTPPMPSKFNSTKAVRPPFYGLVVPLITPLNDRGELVVSDLESLINHVVEQGADAVLVLGSNGEGASLSSIQQRRVIQETSRVVGRRAHVFVNVSMNSRAETLSLARYARGTGAGAVVLTPPSYFKVTDEELVAYVEGLASDIKLPIFLYNIPQLTKTAYTPEVIGRLAANERIVGIKDSTGDIEAFRATLAATKDQPDFSILIGSESILAQCLSEGAAGGVCGSANVNPRLIAELVRASREGDVDTVARASAQLNRWKDAMSEVGGTDPNGALKCFKVGLAEMRICEHADPARPLAPLSQDQVKLLRKHLLSLGW